MGLVNGRWPIRGVLFLTSALCPVLAAVPVLALPENPSVRAGQVEIQRNGAAMTVEQAGRAAIVNWQSFGVGAGEQLRFAMPDGRSAILNRVTGPDASQILGRLDANGSVYLINRNGIVIGRDAVVDTKGFVASTLDIADQNFLGGGAQSFVGDSDASVVNHGTVRAAEGDVLLLGHSVANTGRIEAPLGTAALAAGTDILYVPRSDQPVAVRANLPATRKKTGAENSGVIEAAAIELKAAGGSVYELAVNQTGVVRANAVANRGGRVVLTAEGGTVRHAGTVSASKGENGGDVRIGGGARGSEPGIANAERTEITAAATINVDARGAKGQGGTAVVWADRTTEFTGRASARGGARGGNGGMVEVSAPSLMFQPAAPVDLRAPGGNAGTLLLDPADITIANLNSLNVTQVGSTFGATANGILSTTTLQNALGNGNVTVQTPNDGGSITVNGQVTWANSNSLTLKAAGSITINASVTGGTNSTLSLQVGQGGTATVDAGATVSVGTLTFGRNTDATTFLGGGLASIGGFTANGTLIVDTLQVDRPVSLTGAIGATNSANRIGTFRTTGAGGIGGSGIDIVDGAGGLNAEISVANMEGPTVRLRTEGNLTMLAGSSIAFMPNPANVVLVANNGAFINQAGAGLLSSIDTAQAQGFRIYSSSPGATTLNGVSGTTVYSATYASHPSPGNGNWVLYASAEPTTTTTTTTETTEPTTPVARIDLLISAADATRLYGDDNPALAWTATGLQSGDTYAANVNGTPRLSTAAVPSSPVGTYAIVIDGSGLTSARYALRFANGTLTIQPAPVVATIRDATRLYGDSNPVFSATYSGFKLGDNAGVVLGEAFSTAATTVSGVGTYAITGTGSASNYTIRYVNGTLTVDPAPVVATIRDATRLYGDANPVFSATYSGFKLGDNAGVVLGEAFSTAATTASGVGTYAITGTGSASNYAIRYVNGTLTVDPAPLFVLTRNAQVSYLDSVVPFVSVSGLRNGDSLGSVLRSYGVSVPGDVWSRTPGTYTLTPTGDLASANYRLVPVPRSLFVVPLAVELTAANATVKKNDPMPTLTASAGATLPTQHRVEARTTATGTGNAGTYTITPVLIGPDGRPVNPAHFNITARNGTLTVTDSNPVVTASSIILSNTVTTNTNRDTTNQSVVLLTTEVRTDSTPINFSNLLQNPTTTPVTVTVVNIRGPMTESEMRYVSEIVPTQLYDYARGMARSPERFNINDPAVLQMFQDIASYNISSYDFLNLVSSGNATARRVFEISSRIFAQNIVLSLTNNSLQAQKRIVDRMTERVREARLAQAARAKADLDRLMEAKVAQSGGPSGIFAQAADTPLDQSIRNAQAIYNNSLAHAREPFNSVRDLFGSDGKINAIYRQEFADAARSLFMDSFAR